MSFSLGSRENTPKLELYIERPSTIKKQTVKIDDCRSSNTLTPMRAAPIHLRPLPLVVPAVRPTNFELYLNAEPPCSPAAHPKPSRASRAQSFADVSGCSDRSCWLRVRVPKAPPQTGRVPAPAEPSFRMGVSPLAAGHLQALRFLIRSLSRARPRAFLRLPFLPAPPWCHNDKSVDDENIFSKLDVCRGRLRDDESRLLSTSLISSPRRPLGVVVYLAASAAASVAASAASASVVAPLPNGPTPISSSVLLSSSCFRRTLPSSSVLYELVLVPPSPDVLGGVPPPAVVPARAVPLLSLLFVLPSSPPPCSKPSPLPGVGPLLNIWIAFTRLDRRFRLLLRSSGDAGGVAGTGTSTASRLLSPTFSFATHIASFALLFRVVWGSSERGEGGQG